MRNRQDFNFEYDCDLDKVLSDMEYFSDDIEAELVYKDKVIKYYLDK
jgi:hypothetical protein